MRTSRGLKWENKTYKLKRSIAEALKNTESKDCNLSDKEKLAPSKETLLTEEMLKCGYNTYRKCPAEANKAQRKPLQQDAERIKVIRKGIPGRAVVRLY